jgi:septum formation protein
LNSSTRSRLTNQSPVSPVANDRRIALASKSPRRLEILTKFGFLTEIVDSSFDESTLPGNLDPRAHVLSAARGKALGAVHSLPIVAGDTIVVIDNEILGKPKNAEDSSRMLHRLSGRWHQVFSAVALKYGSKLAAVADRSGVRFKLLSDRQIQDYIATGEPMGKAGAYAIQGLGSRHVDDFSGSYWNIVGFPIEAFMEMWESFFVASALDS